MDIILRIVFIFNHATKLIIPHILLNFKQIILADAIILIPVSYIIWLFWGIPSPIAIFFWCIVSIFTIAMTAHYLAQLSYENITTKENSEKLI